MNQQYGGDNPNAPRCPYCGCELPLGNNMMPGQPPGGMGSMPGPPGMAGSQGMPPGQPGMPGGPGGAAGMDPQTSMLLQALMGGG